jgi:amino acid adenylation domain-containing protein/non-ribosomal peptide synthase protein (TIGR01720 family)
MMRSMTIIEAFSRRVAASPNAVALTHRGRSWSYRQLDQHSRRLARWLRRRARLDVTQEREPLIPVCLEQGPERVSALLAVLKLGGAFVPIEPDYPAARIRYMLDDIDARVLVTESTLRADMLAAIGDARVVELLDIDTNKLAIANEDPSELDVEIGPESLCYVMYTSGSTGRPKGVAIPHRGVTRLVLDTDYVDIQPDDCFAQASNIAFDASTFEIWGPLLNGARAALLSKDVVLDSRELARAIADEGITVMFLTTGLFNQHVASDPEMFGPLRQLYFGGEATSVDVVRRLLSAKRPPTRLFNVYGPTENTTFSSFHPIVAPPEPGVPVPIGKAIRNSSCRVVDAELRPVSAGEVGELLVGGLGLARGYRNQPELTAERFIVLEGERCYRTGDLVRELPSGDLLFVGRADNQVKIRGFRIELEEIELALEAHPALARAVVIVADDVAGTRRLVAHLLVEPEAATPSVAELRAFVEERIPAFMVPASFVRVERIPLGPTGKVDRKALAQAGGEVLWAEDSFVEPRSELEIWLRQVWSLRLRVPAAQIGVEHDFFALGGHSLAAAAVAADVREGRGVELRAQQLFTASTIAKLAQAIERASVSATVEIPTIERTDDLPLSWSQEQIWLHQERAGDVPIYNEPLDITIDEAICPAHMEEALHVLTSRHEALRARIGLRAGTLRQWIAAPERTRLPYHDLRHLPQRRAEARAMELARRQATRSFKLDGEPLVRFTLVRLDEQRSRLYLVGHHLVLDGVGIFQVFLPELETVYRQLEAGEAPSLPPLRFGYRDWLVWQQHERAVREGWDVQEAFWKHKLAELTPLPLPVDHARGVRESYVGARQCLAISQSTTTRLRELARRERSSLFAVLFAALKVLLFRWTGERDLAIGTVVAGRNLAGLEQHVGDFLNTLILRSEVAVDASFLDVLASARTTLHEAFTHQDVPFQRVSRHVTVNSSLSGGEIPVRVALVLEPRVAETRGAWQLSQLEVHTDTAKFDLTFELDERPDRIIGRIEYRCDLFEADTIARLIRTFETLLGSIVDGPQRPVTELELLAEQDREVLLLEWQDNEVDYDAQRCLHELIEARVDQHPEATAVCCEDRRLSFAELDQQANRLAHRLRELGVGPEVAVAVWTERSELHVVMLYAVLKAGGAYVPIGTDDPDDRVRFIVCETAAPVVLCDAEHRDRLRAMNLDAQLLELDDAGETLPATRPHVAVGPDNLAYIIYTSGSTGRPKGVMVEHRQIVDRTHWGIATLGPTNPIAFLQMFSLAFDGALISTWWALANGAAIVMPSNRSVRDPEALARLIVHHGVTHVSATPTMFAVLADVLEREAELPLRWLMPAGERLSEDLHARLLRLAPTVVNGYGPTEITIIATTWEAPASVDKTLIGFGLANTRLYVLDPRRQLVPIGVPGELWVGGRGVARGYLQRPELNEKQFVADPFASAGGRMYGTGDLVRFLPSGDLEYLGRIDRQVKIRGYRIELPEIEVSLRSAAGVRDAAVIVHERPQGVRRLVAYVVGDALDPTHLRAHLNVSLPDYMIPAAFVFVDVLPLTANGKLNIRALPEPPSESGQALDTHDAPRNEFERTLHEIWSEILGIDRIGIHQDFYALGGESLLALRMVAKATEAGLSLRLRDLFEHRTIAALATWLFRATHVDRFANRAPQPLDEGALSGPCPLLPIQRWFFEQRFEQPDHWNQAFVFVARETLDGERLQQALYALVREHDAFRMHFRSDAERGPEQVCVADADPATVLCWESFDLSGRSAAEQELAIETTAERLAATLNHATGPVLAAALFDAGPQRAQRVWIGAHHLVIDGVSWRVLLDDLDRAYAQLGRGEVVRLPPKSCSLRHFAMLLTAHTNQVAVAELQYWREQLAGPPARIRGAELSTPGTEAASKTLQRRLRAGLLTAISGAMGVELNAVLLGALTIALADRIETREWVVWLEGHGREAITDDVDLSRTIGWFTSLFPLRMPAAHGDDPEALLTDIHERLRRVPQRGLGFLALRQLADDPAIRESLAMPTPLPLTFNYLGRFDGQPDKLLCMSEEPAGRLHAGANHRHAGLELNCFVLDGQLRIAWTFNPESVPEPLVATIADGFCAALENLAARKLDTAATLVAATANCVLPLRSGGTQRPLFLIHPAGGSALCYRQLAQHLSDDQPVHGLECVDGYAGKTIGGMAASYATAIRSVQPSGPYVVGGWSLGGILAHEVAALLEAAGERVELVVQLDSRPITHARQLEYMVNMVEDAALLLALLTRHLEQIAGKPIDIGHAELAAIATDEVHDWFMDQLVARQVFPAALIHGFVRRFLDDFRGCYRMLLAHREPARVRAPVVLFRATEISTPHEGFLPLEEPAGPGADRSYGWTALCPGGVTVRMIPGNHETCVFVPHVAQLAGALDEVLASARSASHRYQSGRVLDQLTAAQWRVLLEHLDVLTVRAGDAIVREREATRELYIIAEGEFEVTVETRDRGRERLRVIGPNTILGEISFVDGEPRTATVSALSEGLVYRLTPDGFTRLQSDAPELASLLMLLLAQILAARTRAATVSRAGHLR